MPGLPRLSRNGELARPAKPVVRVCWHSGNKGVPLRAYQYAQRVIVTDAPLSLPRAALAGGGVLHASAAATDFDFTPIERIYKGPGAFAGRRVSMRCELTSSGFVISAGHNARLFVSRDGKAVRRLSGSECDFDKEVLLGPVMTLSLALQGLFTLHTSAVVTTGGAGVCFLGESGAGKSTAAEYVSASWPMARRVADDLAPFQLKEGLRLITGMPQAKMPAHHDNASAPRSYPVTHLVWLAPVEGGAEHFGIQALRPGEIIRRLVESSIGTRLFDKALLRRHFEFCSRASRQVPGCVSRLPRTGRSLVELSGYLRSVEPAALSGAIAGD